MINYKVDQNVIRYRKDKQRNRKEVGVCFMEALSIDPLGEDSVVLGQRTTALSLAR